jgi:hypothetical protein
LDLSAQGCACHDAAKRRREARATLGNAPQKSPTLKAMQPCQTALGSSLIGIDPGAGGMPWCNPLPEPGREASMNNARPSMKPQGEMSMNNARPPPNPLRRGEGETGAASWEYRGSGLALVHGFNARNFSLGEFSPRAEPRLGTAPPGRGRNKCHVSTISGRQMDLGSGHFPVALLRHPATQSRTVSSGAVPPQAAE